MSKQKQDEDLSFIFLGIAIKLALLGLVLLPFALVLGGLAWWFWPRTAVQPKPAAVAVSSPTPAPSKDLQVPGFSPEENQQFLSDYRAAMRSFNQGDAQAFFSAYAAPVQPGPAQVFDSMYPARLRQTIGQIDYFMLVPDSHPTVVQEDDVDGNRRMGLPDHWRRVTFYVFLHGSNGTAHDTFRLRNIGDGWKAMDHRIEASSAPLPAHDPSAEYHL
jgi:hypothetical protein